MPGEIEIKKRKLQEGNFKMEVKQQFCCSNFVAAIWWKFRKEVKIKKRTEV